MKRTDAPQIAVLVKRFPKISETFILQELLGLERQRFTLHIFSLFQPSDSVTHAAVQEVQAPVSYLQQLGLGARLANPFRHLCMLFFHPLRYAATLRRVVAIDEPEKWQAFWRAGILAQRLLAARIAHLYAHFIDMPVTVAELASSLSGIPFSISAHAKDIWLSPPPSLARKIRRAQFTVTCTESNRRYLGGLAGADATVHRAYHGVDGKQFKPDRHSVKDDPPLILSIGRYRKKKGFATLIEACGILRKEGYVFRCAIVGYGPDHHLLEQQIHREGLANYVTLTGKLNHTAVLALYRRATAFALPCRIDADGDRDGIPNVLLEAMAVQLPIVSTSVSAIPELIQDQQNGLLVAPDDPTSLAAAIQQLLDDATLCTQLGAAGRRHVSRRFDVDTNVATLAGLLYAAVNEQQTSSLREQEAL